MQGRPDFDCVTVESVSHPHSLDGGHVSHLEVAEDFVEVLGVRLCNQRRDASHLQDAVGGFLEIAAPGVDFLGARLEKVGSNLQDRGHHPLEPSVLQLVVVRVEGHEGEAVLAQLVFVSVHDRRDAGGGDGSGDDHGVG